MNPEDVRERMKVTVNANIDLTKQLWSWDGDMKNMAGSGTPYEVQLVGEAQPVMGREKAIRVSINGYYFAPEDLTYYEPENSEEIGIQTVKKVKFDPANL